MIGMLLNLVYAGLLICAAPFLLYSAIRKGKYREGFTAKLFGLTNLPPARKPRIWLHAVSVGEVNLLKTIVDKIVQHWPDYEVVISTTTKTGYELAKTKYTSHHIFYFPLDFTWSVRNVLKTVNPKLLILAELEIWPNLLRQCKRSDIPVAILNGRLSANSFRGYSRIKRITKPILQDIDLVLPQNKVYRSRFVELGTNPEKTIVCGSIKFDGAETNRKNPRSQALRELIRLRPDEQVFIAGSTQATEESLALETFLKLSEKFENLRLIIVPRHAERFDEVAHEINCRLRDTQFELIRRSELANSSSFKKDRGEFRIMLVDTIGELSAWWGLADIAFVGGSFGNRGGQNMIEPAAYGAAVSFGPNTRNFKDIVDSLLANNAALELHMREQLSTFVQQCLENPDFAKTLGKNGATFVKAQKGATEQSFALLSDLIGANRKLNKVA